MRCQCTTSSLHQVVVDPGEGEVVLAPVACEEGDSVSLAYLWRQTPIETPVTSLTKEINLLKYLL